MNVDVVNVYVMNVNVIMNVDVVNVDVNVFISFSNGGLEWNGVH